MHKIIFFTVIGLFTFSSCQPQVKEEVKTEEPPASTLPDTSYTPTLTRQWESEAKFPAAESVLLDTVGNVLYVSCINGTPADKKDGDGFIAKLGIDGKIINLKWATGLDAPKGLGKTGDLLYVADIDKVVAIDVNTGKINNSWKVAGASFLNDVSTSVEGVIYISDTNKSTIFQLAKGKITPMFTDTTIHGMNGLKVDGKRLLVAADGATYAVDIASHGVTKITEGIPSGDGIDRYHEGIIQSSWNGEVFYIDPAGQSKKILDTKDVKLNSADIEVVENKNLLYVPTFFGNRVTAYSIK